MNSFYQRRKIKSWLGWTFAWLSTFLVLLGLFDMLGTILIKGAASFRFSMLFEITKGIGGGLQNAILGTFMLIIVTTVIAAPLGILGGVYISEFSNKRLARTIRFLTEVLSGVPSIVIGYFGYLLFVLRWGWGYSVLGGAIALTIIMLPFILRTTESSLLQVPLTLREAAWGLGMTEFQAIYKVVWPAATNGIATGVLLAVAIGMGETAPLLYTAGWSMMNPSLGLIHHRIGYLTYVVWTYIDMPYDKSHALAYSAAFVLLIIILVINIGVRMLIARSEIKR